MMHYGRRLIEILTEFCTRRENFAQIDAFEERGEEGGLYFAKTDSAKSEIQYRNVVNRTLPNQEYAKPESAKTYSGIC